MRFNFVVRSQVTTALAVVLMSVVCTGVAQAQKTAIANPSKIFAEMQETKDFVEKMKNEVKNFETERQSRAVKLKDLQSQRDMFKPDSAQFADTDRKLLDMSVEFEVFVRGYTARLEKTRKNQIVKLFDKISSGVAKVGAAKGIDIVIADVRPELPPQNTEQYEQMNENALKGLLAQRNVLYNTEAVDLSAAVIAQMDADYKAGK